jgi:quinol monooxygenase YgiN
MIHVIAMISAKPGQRDALLELFRANVPNVHAEDGCIEYGAAVDVDVLGRHQAMLGPDSLIVVEKWASGDALKAHAASPHMAAYAAKSKDLIAARAIHVLSPT